jgi:hypothetical protein
MARRLGLSRARFYQLMRKGVFPPPVRSGTRRPFYPPDLQQKCLQIRRTGVGFNGRPVLFNKRRTRRPVRSEHGAEYNGLVAALKNMGLKVNASAVERAIRTLYPAGLDESQDPNEVLRDLFRHLHPDCHNDV